MYLASLRRTLRLETLKTGERRQTGHVVGGGDRGRAGTKSEEERMQPQDKMMGSDTAAAETAAVVGSMYEGNTSNRSNLSRTLRSKSGEAEDMAEAAQGGRAAEEQEAEPPAPAEEAEEAGEAPARTRGERRIPRDALSALRHGHTELSQHRSTPQRAQFAKGSAPLWPCVPYLESLPACV